MSTQTYRVLEISPHEMSLSLQHMENFAKLKNLAWEVELYPALDESLLVGAAGVRVDFSVSDQIFSSISTFPTQVRDVECFDSFIYEGGKWYPRLMLFEALRGLIVERVRDLDIRTCAYLIGDNVEARVVAAVMTDLGYSTICIVGDNPERLNKLSAHLRKKFIGVDFHEVSSTDMTLQTVQGSLMVNCTDLSSDHNLQNDLSYFNFMKRGGLVLDLLRVGEKSLLLEEAIKAELHVIKAADFYLRRDLLFLSKIGLSNQFSEQEFVTSWEDFLKSHPSSSYKKRHS